MIIITQEMLNQLTVLYNENEKKYDHWVDVVLKETDPAKRRLYDKYAFGRHCKSTAMDKVFDILGLKADINTDDYEYTVKEVNNGNEN